MKKEKELPESEVLLNCFQICNHFQIMGRNRRVADMKFKGLNLTIKEWETKLKGDNLLK